MKTMHKNFKPAGRLGAIAVMGAVAVAPLVGAVNPAQAAPQVYTPGTGWHQVRDTRDTKDYRYDRTLRGIVTQGLRDDLFQVQTDRGQILRVLARAGEPRVGVGTRVELTGSLDRDRDMFIADNITRLGDRVPDRDWDDVPRDLVPVHFAGRIVAIPSDRRLVVRADNEREYNIAAVHGVAPGFRVGDYVRIAGQGRNNFVRAERIRR